MSRRFGRCALLAALTLGLSVLLFLLLHTYDNKYTVQSPQAVNGILSLEEGTLEQYPLLFLVNGWEYFGGKAMTPEEYWSDDGLSGRDVFIGQYAGLEAFDPERSPHGSATYCLNITIPDEPRDYMLELPEIYSAYRLYVNGSLKKQMGRPEPGDYLPETGNTFVVFEASHHIELVLAVSDFSHYYSGLVYPPAFGAPDAVSRLLSTRLLLRGAVCAIALFLALFFLAVGILQHRSDGKRPEPSQALLYALLCLCFMGYTGYPMIKTLLAGGMWWYAAEHFCYCAMLLLVVLLQSRLCGGGGILFPICAGAGGVMCAASLLLPVLSRSGSLTLFLAFSRITNLYFLLCAVFLTVTALMGVRHKHIYSPVLFCGTLVFDVSLVMDRLLPDFEPILTGWFTEWAGATLVVCIGGVIGQDIVRQYQERLVLEGRVDNITRLMELERAWYPVVLEQVEEARAARHDLRHHLIAVRELMECEDKSKLGEYLDGLGCSVDKALAPIVFTENYMANVLLRYYSSVAEQRKIPLRIHAELPPRLPLSDPDFYSILGNLMENALEASAHLPERERLVEVYLRLVAGSFVLIVDNRFDGIVNKSGERLLSRKQAGREGVGTLSVRQIAAQHGGSAQFSWEMEEPAPLFQAKVVLPI